MGKVGIEKLASEISLSIIEVFAARSVLNPMILPPFRPRHRQPAAGLCVSAAPPKAASVCWERKQLDHIL